ncbi:MAG TPA: response regulator [Pyrinomonadaceae bacterium]|jgi:two-component system phosphate regulon response regulator PhoB|nr:response regulator [Pyrinomonadaceae bacterium]
MKIPRILLVEDHADTRELMVFLLTQANYEVLSAGCVAEALILLKKEDPDLVVLDSWLPDGNGLELCKHLRHLTPTTPILFCSGLAYEADKQEALTSGAHAYLVKPVDPNLLYSTVAQLLTTTAESKGVATVL